MIKKESFNYNLSVYKKFNLKLFKNVLNNKKILYNKY